MSTSFSSGYGVTVNEYPFTNSEGNEIEKHVVIELDSSTKLDIEFITEFRNYSGLWDGRAAGETVQQLVNEIAAIKSQLAQDEYYRINNPAVGAAWEHYQTMLGLAKEYGDQNK